MANDRRGFLRRLLSGAGLAAAVPAGGVAQTGSGRGDSPLLPRYARAQNYKSLKQSSYDRTGGNRDSWTIAAGRRRRKSSTPQGPGVISISGSRSRRRAAII